MTAFELAGVLVVRDVTGIGSVWAYQAGGYETARMVPMAPDGNLQSLGSKLSRGAR